MKKQLTLRHRLVCAIPFSLLQFLIDYNCLDKYLDNTLSELSVAFIDNIENQGKLLEQQSPEDFFARAFIWKNSPEGYDYWYRRRLWYVQELKQQN